MNERLETLSLAIRQNHEAESKEREEFRFHLQQYEVLCQTRIEGLLQSAAEHDIRSDVRLNDLAESLAPEKRVAEQQDDIPNDGKPVRFTSEEPGDGQLQTNGKSDSMH